MIRLPEGGSSYNPNPGGLSLSQGEGRAADTNNEGIAKRGGMRDDHILARRETQIEETVAVFLRAIEAVDMEGPA